MYAGPKFEIKCTMLMLQQVIVATVFAYARKLFTFCIEWYDQRDQYAAS